MTLFRALIFDLDGTLVDSYAALTDAVNHALLEHGAGAVTDVELRTMVGDGIDQLLRRAWRREEPLAAGLKRSFEERYDSVCIPGSRLLDEVESTLRELNGRGIAMAVCTNKTTRFSEKILEALGIRPLFTAVVGPDLAGAQKPDGAHVLRALRDTGAKASEALFVGDMPVDVMAARNARLRCAAIATGSASRASLEAANADYLLDRFSQLLEIVGPL